MAPPKSIERDQLLRERRVEEKGIDKPWPSSLTVTFQGVANIKNISLDQYRTSALQDPYKTNNVRRAVRLANEVERLGRRKAAEMDWRLISEPEVLQRFSLKAACPQCGGHLFAPEGKPPLPYSSPILEERNRNRKECSCPYGKRPQSPYEMEANELYRMSAERPFVTSPPEGSGGLIQKPDRVIGFVGARGLRERHEKAALAIGRTHQHPLRASPFTREDPAPLFPFLLLEAKTSTASSDDSAMAKQTGLPIWNLLRIQQDLQSMLGVAERLQEFALHPPLVWFLGFRGSNWRVSGCYVTSDNEGSRYEIHTLWFGNIADPERALQLFLIIDYIEQWARCTFQLSLTRVLKTLASDKSFDEQSEVTASGIYDQTTGQPDEQVGIAESMILDQAPDRTETNLVQGWMEGLRNIRIDTPMNGTVMDCDSPGARTVIQIDEEMNDAGVNPFDSAPNQQSLFNTTLGQVRVLSWQSFRFRGVFLTRENIEKALHLGTPTSLQHLPAALIVPAQHLLEQLGRFRDVLFMGRSDLIKIETQWTGEKNHGGRPVLSGLDGKYLVVLEYRCFMTPQWEIVRELNCLAVTQSAFATLKYHATKTLLKTPVATHWESARSCDALILSSAIRCLRSGSRMQVFQSAISSTAFVLSPGPALDKYGFTPPVRYIRFRRPSTLQLYPFVGIELQRMALTSKRDEHAPRSDEHVAPLCPRCKPAGQDVFAQDLWDPTATQKLTSSDMFLVAALQDETQSSVTPQDNHDICLFVLPHHSAIDRNSFARILEQMQVAKKETTAIYHTILHDPLGCSDARHILWNLPYPYRKCTNVEIDGIMRFGLELEGTPRPPVIFKMRMPLWVRLQIWLHCMCDTDSQDAAEVALTGCRDQLIGDPVDKRYRVQNAAEITLLHFWSKYRDPPRGEFF